MSDKDKQAFILYGSIAAVLGFASKLLYRPWIVSNALNDYGVQGFAPSFFYVAGACLLVVGFSSKNQVKNMLYAAAGATVYELEQYFTSMTLDFKDLLATAAGLGVALLLRKTILQRSRQNLIESDSCEEDNETTHFQSIKT